MVRDVAHKNGMLEKYNMYFNNIVDFVVYWVGILINIILVQVLDKVSAVFIKMSLSQMQETKSTCTCIFPFLIRQLQFVVCIC
jgi:hypothetical protein